MKWIKYPFALLWQVIKVLFFSLVGIYSKTKRKQAMQIIKSWNKLVLAILFAFISFIYFYTILYLIKMIKLSY